MTEIEILHFRKKSQTQIVFLGYLVYELGIAKFFIAWRFIIYKSITQQECRYIMNIILQMIFAY